MKHEVLSAASALATTYLGRGINVLTWKLGDPPNGAPIVDLSTLEVDKLKINKVEQSNTIEKSFVSFEKSFAMSVGISGSYKGFSGSVSSKFSSTDKTNVDSEFAEFSTIATGERHTMVIPVSGLGGHFTEEFQDYIDSGDIGNIFEIYGTHLPTVVYVGGMIRYYCWSKTTETLSTTEFSVDAQAKYDLVLKSIGVKSSISQKTEEEAKHVSGATTLEVHGGSQAASLNLSGMKDGSFAEWAQTVEANPAFLKFGQGCLKPVWELASSPERQEEIHTYFKKMLARNPTIVTISKTSPVEVHPDEVITLADLGVEIGADDYKLLSGGAVDNWTGEGNLLTASYPQTLKAWEARGKDHHVNSPASVTVYLSAIYDPEDIWENKLFSQTSEKANHPTAEVDLPAGWVLSGGGALVNYSGDGSLLTASYPKLAADGMTPVGWVAASKDHQTGDPATVTAYAVGLKCNLEGITAQTLVSQATSAPEEWPVQSVSVGEGDMVGGGAWDQWSGEGNLLTASYPLNDYEWEAKGKSHNLEDAARITAYAIGLVVE